MQYRISAVLQKKQQACGVTLLNRLELVCATPCGNISRTAHIEIHPFVVPVAGGSSLWWCHKTNDLECAQAEMAVCRVVSHAAAVGGGLKAMPEFITSDLYSFLGSSQGSAISYYTHTESLSAVFILHSFCLSSLISFFPMLVFFFFSLILQSYQAVFLLFGKSRLQISPRIPDILTVYS